jgi:ornithine cyclodeaminase/alanine dehydrogenase-like protein (mu-crystallin family)
MCEVEPQIEVLVLTMEEVEKLISRQDVLDAVETAYKALGTKDQLFQPQKEPIYVDHPEHYNFVIAMPCYLRSTGVAGVKWGGFYGHQQPGIPACWGAIIALNNPENGQPYAIMDGTYITNVRTAGGHAAVAAKYLAKKDSKTMAVIGCGTEGRAGLPSFNDLFPLETVKIYDVNPETMSTYKRELSKQVSANIIPTNSAEEAVKDTDIILIATASHKPVVLEPWVPPGCFVAALTRFLDLDYKLSEKADKWVIGDKKTDGHMIVDRHTWSDHADGVIVSWDNVYADMGEIVTGAKPGRENDRERILYTHMGMGAHDVALAQIAYKRAVEKGVGKKVRLI